VNLGDEADVEVVGLDVKAGAFQGDNLHMAAT
jgi:hypothetical protein